MLSVEGSFGRGFDSRRLHQVLCFQYFTYYNAVVCVQPCGSLLPFDISPAEQFYFSPQRNRVNGCAKARPSEIIGYVELDFPLQICALLRASAISQYLTQAMHG